MKEGTQCPRCGSTVFHRSMRRGLSEGLLLRLRHRAPFRCRRCGHRFIGPWSGPGPEEGVAASGRRARRPRRQSLVSFLGLRDSLGSQGIVIFLIAVVGLIGVLVAFWLLTRISGSGGPAEGFFQWLGSLFGPASPP